MNEISSVCEGAILHTTVAFGPLSKREREIAETAARSAYRWTLREVVEDLERKVTQS